MGHGISAFHHRVTETQRKTRQNSTTKSRRKTKGTECLIHAFPSDPLKPMCGLNGPQDFCFSPQSHRDTEEGPGKIQPRRAEGTRRGRMGVSGIISVTHSSQSAA